MEKQYLNKVFLVRLDELIQEGEQRWEEFKNDPNQMIMDIVGFTQWATSGLNLLDKLSVSTNRFVSQFEAYVTGGPGQKKNIGAALGVLKSARYEYSAGLAVEYHLSVSAAVFGGLLDEASYLHTRGYLRAAMVLAGAALEEALKARANTVSIEMSGKETLIPLIHKLKSPEIGILTEFHAKQLEAIGKMRNDAAHGGEFNYSKDEVARALTEISGFVQRLLSEK
jgi:hypothetical protein